MDKGRLAGLQCGGAYRLGRGKKRYARSRRVAVVVGDYVVVIRLSNYQKAQFVTAYVADSPSTLAKIKGSPKWVPSQ
mgnify:CR=1 FL=1